MHTWLPDAHSEAPAPVSAMLSGALLAAAFYAILRFFQVAVATDQRSFAEHVLIVFGVIALVLASFSVIRQGNFKRLLAYSSIEHMGIIAIGIGFGAPLAVVGALLHVITHASAKGLAFFGAGSLLRGYDTKQVDEVTDAAHRMPFTGPMFMAAALALCGLPLSGVFRSEFDIVTGGFSQPQYVGVTLLLIFVNIAFFGIIWHAGRMVLSSRRRPRDGNARPMRGAQPLDDRRDARPPFRRRRARCPPTGGPLRVVEQRLSSPGACQLTAITHKVRDFPVRSPDGLRAVPEPGAARRGSPARLARRAAPRHRSAAPLRRAVHHHDPVP